MRLTRRTRRGADCYVGGLDYVGTRIEGSTDSLMMQIPDDKFGLPGRWAPEVGAQLILSHAPGRIVIVTAKIDTGASGITLEDARGANSFNVTLKENSTERLDPGSGVVLCVPDGAFSPPPSPAPSPEYPPNESPDRAPLPHRWPQRPPYRRPAPQHGRAAACAPQHRRSGFPVPHPRQNVHTPSLRRTRCRFRVLRRHALLDAR